MGRIYPGHDGESVESFEGRYAAHCASRRKIGREPDTVEVFGAGQPATVAAVLATHNARDSAERLVYEGQGRDQHVRPWIWDALTPYALRRLAADDPDSNEANPSVGALATRIAGADASSALTEAVRQLLVEFVVARADELSEDEPDW